MQTEVINKASNTKTDTTTSTTCMKGLQIVAQKLTNKYNPPSSTTDINIVSNNDFVLHAQIKEKNQTQTDADLQKHLSTLERLMKSEREGEILKNQLMLMKGMGGWRKWCDQVALNKQVWLLLVSYFFVYISSFQLIFVIYIFSIIILF